MPNSAISMDIDGKGREGVMCRELQRMALCPSAVHVTTKEPEGSLVTLKVAAQRKMKCAGQSKFPNVICLWHKQHGQYPSAGFGAAFILAHEIGHSLGMRHDHHNGCHKVLHLLSK